MEVHASNITFLRRLEAAMLWLRVGSLEINVANSSVLSHWEASRSPKFR